LPGGVVEDLPRGYTKCPKCGKPIPIVWLRGYYLCGEKGHLYFYAEKKPLDRCRR